jgi:hypothetical protein
MPLKPLRFGAGVPTTGGASAATRKEENTPQEVNFVVQEEVMEGLLIHAGAEKVGRQDLLSLPTPEATETHKPVPHSRVIEALVESLDYRKIQVVRDEYAISKDAMKMFGFLELSLSETDIRIAIGIRNSHDKSFSLGLTVGYRVFVCDNLAFHGDFTPITRKHSKYFDVDEVISGAVDKAQRHFNPMVRQIDVWKDFNLSDASAKLIVYQAFVESDLFPKHLARDVHREYFEPQYDEFRPRNMWSLSNAFTSAFKTLDAIPQFQNTGKLAGFLGQFNA